MKMPVFTDKHVVLASGINFETGQPVVVNPVTGEEIKNCVDSTEPNCSTEIVAPESLNEIIKNFGGVVDGTVIRDGKEIPARFVVSVTALYEGSQCITYWVNGVKYTICF